MNQAESNIKGFTWTDALRQIDRSQVKTRLCRGFRGTSCISESDGIQGPVSALNRG